MRSLIQTETNKKFNISTVIIDQYLFPLFGRRDTGQSYAFLLCETHFISFTFVNTQTKHPSTLKMGSYKREQLEVRVRGGRFER